jgi:hypothetical protein
MKQEELKVKNLCAIEEETSKYIFITIMKGNDFVTSRNQLAAELGLSKRMISSKFREASRKVNEKIRENKEIELQKYYQKCNKSGLLDLEEMSKHENIESEELKNIFTDYVESFTEEESNLAEKFSWSIDALKKGNVQTLKNRVNGFSERPKYANQVFYHNVMEQDIQFLKSIPDICESYYAKNKSSNKVKVLVNKEQ